MSKKLKNILLAVLSCVFIFAITACSLIDEKIDVTKSNETTFATTIEPTGDYNEGIVLVKDTTKSLKKSDFASVGVKSVQPLYKNSTWYQVELVDKAATESTVNYLNSLNVFDKVDYDYVMKADGEVQSVDISGNTYAEDLKHLDTLGIKKGWESNLNNGKTPGGSADVVIAVIDTGVDYNHLDLRNNIWVNSAEVPNNGIDDDGNGYVDDINGWDCVGNDNDPMDDNGHGTHVAGIAAAENNKIGTVGVAYNCKIMCLKAGNSSGYFNNSDIAEAIQYAYMNGASVINMSFGGSTISMAVEDALMDAYNQCVLVAAAGNDGLCNNIGCLTHYPLVGVSYPAALPYVIGVMSCNENGTAISGFSNFDHYPFGKIEYEVYACGENIVSTWPNNKYATLSGTSMACPTVAGIAAVLRSTYPDREVYSNKYIQSQIVNTGTKGIMTHTVADLHEALTKIPTPNVNLYDYYIFDNKEFSSKNNGDGVIDAGETIHLAVELQNRGGVASDVVVTLDTIRNNDPNLTDPYFNIATSQITLSDIGTYSVRDGGKIYKDNIVSDVQNCFVIEVSDDCPNDYLSNFNVNFSYKNGLDKNDNETYIRSGIVQLSVYSETKLPSVFLQDTTLTADKKYIVSNDVFIPAGVTVNVDPGVEIQFYEGTEAYYNSVYNSPTITVKGELNFNGTADKMIQIYPSELFYDYYCLITKANFKYTSVINLGGYYEDDNVWSGKYNADYSYFSTNTDDGRYYIASGETRIAYTFGSMSFDQISNSYLRLPGFASPGSDATVGINKAEKCYFDLNFGNFGYVNQLNIVEAKDNIFQTTKLENNADDNPRITIDSAENNVFMTSNNSVVAGDCAQLIINDASNTFLDAYGLYYHIVIKDFLSANGDGTPLFDITDKTKVDLTKLWPYVKDITFINSDGEEVKALGAEEFKIKIEFNRAVDTESEMTMFFGSWYPYADYSIKGAFVSDTIWEGTYKVKAFIENGTQYITASNIFAKDEPFKEIVACRGYYHFDLDTTGALSTGTMSMTLQANATDKGINLTWAQDDYDTLLGYNIYRSTEKDGNFVRMNSSLVSSGEKHFVDIEVEPGKTYWYTFTVVLSDFSESHPAGKVSCTAPDTIKPSIYHTPVNQGYLNNNLVISCTASDNVAIESVTLYYRAVGSQQWKTLTMLKQNDKYSATIFGSELTLDGIEYYIVAKDAINSIAKGSPESPYKVVVKDASSISRIGDVDGDGVVTTKDALMIMQTINGDLIMTDDEFKRADLNEDNVLSSIEALRILQYINGNVSTLEM